MWLTGLAGVLFGIICGVQQVCSQSKVVWGKADPTPASPTSLEEDIQRVINQIHSLSGANVNARSSAPLPVEGVDLNTFYSVINNLYALLQPLLKEGFIQDLPKTLVCILSGKEGCGLEAELIKAVATELGQTILTGLTSLKSQTCSPVGAESYSFFRTYITMSNSTVAMLKGIQDTIVNILAYFPVSGNLVTAFSSLVDTVMKYIFELLFSILQVPIEYIQIALQFGISVPSLNEQEICEQGDLKQLIMWGLRHNVSWSFGTALIDILLNTFLAPEQPVCAYPSPECPNPPTVPFQRSALEANNNIDIYRNILLKCDHKNLSSLNETVCAEIVEGLRETSSASVLMFCKALGSLSPLQLELVWSNACYVFQAVVSPLTSRSADCTDVVSYPAPVVNSPQDAPIRIAREASNLKQLVCNYNSWMENNLVDPVLVSLCGDNQREEFVKKVCNNATLMQKLVSDKMNVWLYAYCGNSSADLNYMVRELCQYDQWMFQPALVDSYRLEFCMILDKQRLSRLICENVGFFMLLFSNPSNVHLMPNCSEVLPMPPSPDQTHNVDPCQYSQWHNLTLITMDILSLCSQFDADDFNKEVCANKTFLNILLLNKQNDWLRTHCEKAVIVQTPAYDSFYITDWCDYHTWGDRYVDDSVVGLCWQYDQLTFQKNVCCNPIVFQRLLQDPTNVWLSSVCNKTEEMDKTELLQHVCTYVDWTYPIIVDMTELALCAVIDPDNFTSKVCTNETVVKNLLANQDNTWLIQHCSNHTNPGVSPSGNGGQGQSPIGFNPTEQCLYLSWSISHPDPVLITLCWEHDQAKFVSMICPNPNLLSSLVQEPSSAWVGSMCNTYTNYSTGPDKPYVCVAKDLVKKFNWTCPLDFTLACQPSAGQNVVMQMIVRCWLESLRSRIEDLLTPTVATVLDQAVSMTVVTLLALEEIQNKSYHVTENIRLNILTSVDSYLKKETNFGNKRVLLQCFGRVLTSLMQTTRDISSDESVFIQEYFKIPVEKLQAVLSAAHITTIRMILVYYSRNKNTLQLPLKYLSTMASVLFQTHLATDWSLFPELASLLALASPADIKSLPLLQNNINVRETINLNLNFMSLDQRCAFGAWFGTAMLPNNITRGQRSLIRDTGNLIAYLPFHNFQHLSAAQLLDGLDVLQKNTLSPIKQEFIAQSVTETYRNLTAQDFIRLGKISCLADPDDIIIYKGTGAFPVIQDIVKNCSRDGLNLPSYMLSSLLPNSTQTNNPSSLTVDQLAESAYLLPMLGVNFLQNLTPSQLVAVLPVIKSIRFSTAQASIIVDKLSSVMTLSAPGMLQELGSLIVGIKSEFLLTLTSERLLASLPSMAQQTPGLSPTQANALATKLWGFLDVPNWLDDVEPLLYCTPLVSLLSRTRQLVYNITKTATKPWNTQQAKAIFNQVLELKPSLIKEDFLRLGTVGQGVTCKVLQERLRVNLSPSSVRQILLFLRQQPTPLHTSLKKCVVEEVYQYDFFPEILKDFGAEMALAMPVSTIKKFSVNMTDTLRALIIKEPHYFLLLSRGKQEVLVDKIVQKMSMYTGMFTEEKFRSLGIMATFVMDEIFIQIDRNFFIENLDFMQKFCYSTTKMDIVARILQETDVFGPVKTWNKTTLNQVDRFLFFLPTDKLQEIPLELITVARTEKLFMNQRQWEGGDIGGLCLDANEKRSNFEKQQFVLQFFLGFLKTKHLSSPPIVPSCEMLHSTAPSVWTSTSLTNMSSSAFVNCLELLGQDPFLPSYHRSQLLQKVKKMYGPVASFSQSLISQLGRIAVEMTNEELSSLQLTQRNTIAALGAVDIWNNKQLEILFSVILNSTKQNVSQFDSSTLGAMGYIICGAKASEIIYFNAVEFSKAVLWLGKLKLKCAEDQLLALSGLLSHSLAFGTMSSWGTDVFIEIGIIAAGLPDMAMSSLVKSQIEGITPLAISVIPPAKFSVVFSHQQISMFSHEQAEAVPSTVIDALSYMQKQALAMVLTPWENRPVDFRGRSLGLALSHSPMCLILGLLILLIMLP